MKYVDTKTASLTLKNPHDLADTKSLRFDHDPIGWQHVAERLPFCGRCGRYDADGRCQVFAARSRYTLDGF